jgi:hypothetical protein
MTRYWPNLPLGGREGWYKRARFAKSGEKGGPATDAPSSRRDGAGSGITPSVAENKMPPRR